MIQYNIAHYLGRNNMFTEEMVHTALQTWCDNVVAVGKVHAEGGDVKAFASQVLSDNYDYDNGKVLFKPTLTFGSQTFRLCRPNIG